MSIVNGMTFTPAILTKPGAVRRTGGAHSGPSHPGDPSGSRN